MSDKTDMRVKQPRTNRGISERVEKELRLRIDRAQRLAGPSAASCSLEGCKCRQHSPERQLSAFSAALRSAIRGGAR